MIDRHLLHESAEYWDEVGPQGATHFSPRARIFYKREAGRWFVWHDNARGWVDCGGSYPAVTIKKPEA